MPNKKLLFVVLALLGTTAFTPGGRRIGWDPKERPRLPLVQATQIAHEALNFGEGLPKDDDTFYCLGTGIAITSSRDGDWTFRFGSEEKGVRWVIVDLDGAAAQGPFVMTEPLLQFLVR